MTDEEYNKYAEEIETSYDNGEITYKQFNRYMRELNEEYMEVDT